MWFLTFSHVTVATFQFFFFLFFFFVNVVLRHERIELMQDLRLLYPKKCSYIVLQCLLLTLHNISLKRMIKLTRVILNCMQPWCCSQNSCCFVFRHIQVERRDNCRGQLLLARDGRHGGLCDPHFEDGVRWWSVEDRAVSFESWLREPTWILLRIQRYVHAKLHGTPTQVVTRNCLYSHF